MSCKVAIPTPSFATAQAVKQLQQGHAGTWIDDTGKPWTEAALIASAQSMSSANPNMPAHVEVGPDGKTYRYPFAWHPPDPPIGPNAWHLGVEAWVCDAPIIPAPVPSTTIGGTDWKTVAITAGAAVVVVTAVVFAARYAKKRRR